MPIANIVTLEAGAVGCIYVGNLHDAIYELSLHIGGNVDGMVNNIVLNETNQVQTTDGRLMTICILKIHNNIIRNIAFDHEYLMFYN